MVMVMVVVMVAVEGAGWIHRVSITVSWLRVCQTAISLRLILLIVLLK